MYIFFIAAFVAGIVVGAWLHILTTRSEKTNGILEVNTTDVTRDIYRLNLDDDIESLATRKKIILKVAKTQK